MEDQNQNQPPRDAAPPDSDMPVAEPSSLTESGAGAAQLPMEQPPVVPPPSPVYTPTPNYAMPAGPQTNAWAIISLVSSILGWLGLFGLGGIVGIIAGVVGRNQIKASMGSQSGDGIALAGIILGVINIAFACIAALCLLALVIMPLMALPFMGN
jgi:hypothetical protein